jgi:hypothetical protein
MNMKLLALLSLSCCCLLIAWQHSEGIRYENSQACLARRIDVSRLPQFLENMGFNAWAPDNLQTDWNSNPYLGMPISFDVSPDLSPLVIEILNADLNDHTRMKALAKYTRIGDSFESVERIIGKPWMTDGFGPGYCNCAYLWGLWIKYDPLGRVIGINYHSRSED